MSGRLPSFLLAAALAACTTTDDTRVDRTGDPPRHTWRAVPALAGADVLWDRGADRPRQIVGDFALAGTDVEAGVRGWLRGHAALFALAPDGGDLRLVATRRGLAGHYLRFEQLAGGLPVFDAEVIVAVDPIGKRVRAANLAHAGRIAAPRVDLDIGGAAALAAARAHVPAAPDAVAPVVTRGVDVRGVAPRLAYRVQLGSERTSWEVGVDGASGAILWARDRTWRANGTGMVFDATPVASTNNLALVDGNDANQAALTAARFAVTLPNLDTSGFLRGLYADARARVIGNRAQSATLAFNYDRNDDRFEEVMAYYHLDRAQTRIQALGFTDVNNRVQIAVVNDGNQDNSFYSPTTLQLSFGAGGVDDAEDGDIVLHEYGHSIQDNQVPGWGGGDQGAMGEGFGDYLAGSFGNVLPPAAGHPQPGDQACVGDWDAVSYDTASPPCLRRLDRTKHFAEDASGQVHDDGEIWSASLWRARTAVGADVADRVVLEAHFLQSNNETFAEAAAAILAADQMLYAGSHVPALRRALYHHGLLRAPQPGAAYPTVASANPVNIRNPVEPNGFYANDLDDVQTYTVPGALALRLHFAQIETELDGSCFENACDNVYLFDGQGDLYQTLAGNQLDVTSVQIPGDTVRIRLVTDGSAQLPGYRIDRVDVMTGTPSVDAAIDAPIDAPAPPIDAPVDAAIDAPVPVDAAIDAPVDAPPAIDAAPTADAPPSIDAATPDDEDDDGGCCSTGASPGGALALGGAALALVLRRRRR